MSHNKVFEANIMKWRMPKNLPTFEIRSELVDLGLDSFVRWDAFWEGEHVRLVLTPKDRGGLQKKLDSQVSVNLRKFS